MTRHVLVGRFGSKDEIGIAEAEDEVKTELNLLDGRGAFKYGMGAALKELSSLQVYPTQFGLDLLVLASMVHLADTRLSRDTESQDSWTREIRLVVPVSEPVRWNSQASLIKRILEFLTGDQWTIGFRPRPGEVTVHVPANPDPAKKAPFDSVCLFSGGLDSLVGAIDLLEHDGAPLLVSHAGEGATSKAQNDCFDGLKKRYPSRQFDRLRVWMNFPKKLIRNVASEKTTRGRSFLFLALAAFAGSGLGIPFTLRVPENGLIALNVPLDILRLGSHSTRTTHPFYLDCWNKLLSGLEIPGHIENPFWNKTKGEMVLHCRNPELLRQLVRSSLSCSSPTKARWQKLSAGHCGYCVPCLIRRAAIEAAWGKGQDPTEYLISHLLGRPFDTLQSEGQQIRAFQLAIRRLAEKPQLASVLIHKPGPLGNDSVRLAELSAVYRRGMEEVGQLLDGVITTPG